MGKLLRLFLLVFIFLSTDICTSCFSVTHKKVNHEKSKKVRKSKPVPQNYLKVLGWKYFDMRRYYLDIASVWPTTATVEKMRIMKKAIFAVNGGFFIPSTKVPLGNISRCDVNWTKYTLHERRGVLWQNEFVGIGWAVPDRTLFSIEAGPTLIYKGETTRSMQDFFASFWNQNNCTRNVIATKGNYVYFYRFRGNLWGIAKYLKKRGFGYAINLDGGSSSAPGAKVPNAVVVIPKSNANYQKYQNARWIQEPEN